MNKYRTFVARFWALILDTVLLLPLAIAADALAESSFPEEQRNLFLVILNLANIVYFVALHGFYGQTAGKYLMRLKVVKPDESPIGFARALLRNLPQILLVLGSLHQATNIALGGPPEAPLTPISILVGIWGLADLIVFFINPKRRALHDLIAGTVVIRIEPSPNRLD